MILQTYLTCLCCFLFIFSSAQNVNYTAEILEFYMTGCDDGAGSDEEPTWKVYTRDNISTGWEGGTCHFTDGNIPIVYIPSSGTVIASKSNTTATLIDVRFEAWEDDCDGGSGADRCNFDASCLAGIQEDDCLQYHDPLAGTFGAYPSIDFRNDPDCSWNSYTFSAGDFGLKIRIKWEYSNFTAGSNIDVCDTVVVLGGAGSGEWSVSSGTSGIFTDQYNPTTDFLGTAGQTYVLDWNTLSGCSTLGADNIIVNIFANPDPQLMADQDPICDGANVIFSAQDGLNYDFAMNTISNVLQSSGSDSYSHTGISISDTAAFVTVRNADDCIVIDTLTLNVQSAPMPTITRTGSDLSTGSFFFYQWYYNGSPIGGATSANYTATANGSYTVLVFGSNGCIGESAPEVITNVSIDELGNHYFNTYPNPVQSTLNIETDLPTYRLEFTTLIGQIVIKASNPKSIDVSSIAPGIYILTVKHQGKKSTRKIIVE